jgi:tetratricopeptide (TPR) repeat protein
MTDIQQTLTAVLETHRTGDHDTARAACAEVLQRAPECADAHYVMGLIIQDSGDHLLALRALSQAIRIDSEVCGFHDAMGVSQVALGRQRDGLRSFAEAVRLNPLSRIAVMHMGVLCMRMGLLPRAIACFDGLLAQGENESALHAFRGQSLLRIGRTLEAVDSLHLALDMNPGHIESHLHLGRALYQLDRFSEAATCFRTVAEAQPDNAAVRTDLGASLLAMRELDEAEDVLESSLKLDFNQPEAHANLGSVRAAQGQSESPLRCFVTALRLRPNDLNYRCKLGFMLLEQGYLPKAEHCFRIVLKSDPYSVDAIAGLASTLSKMGDPESALCLAEPLVDNGTDHPDLAHTYASLCRKLGRPNKAIPVVERLLGRSRPKAVKVQLQHALGELLEASGEHHKAFAAHAKANQMRRPVFSPPQHSARVNDLINVFDNTGLSQLPRAANLSRIPVLIVGMPRSGTTLVEQILATHPQIIGAGELEELKMLADALPRIIGTQTPYPYCVEELTPSVATSLSSWYTERLLIKGGEATRVTDKMPQNFLHLGLASLLLPNTRIIHCRRNAMDTALSNYFMHFKESYSFTTQLDWLGEFYVGYRKLMDHWSDVLPNPILNVDYEQLVHSPETEMRRIIDFVGLSWNPSCLRFHTNDRHVLSASAEQVRQPIYTTSVGRSEPYRDLLSPFSDVLKAHGILDVDPGQSSH